MEKTKFYSALASCALLTIGLTSSTILGKPTPQPLFSSSTGGNVLAKRGNAAPAPLKAPDILMPETARTDSSSLQPQGFLPDGPVDFTGDGRTDYVVVRNTGGGPNGQLTWFVAQNGGSSQYGVAWGLNSDWILTQDFDGDLKDDIAIWRPGPGGTAAFYILQSATSTLRVDTFGQTGDVPSIVEDYDGDGKADTAVFRNGSPAQWWYRSSITGVVNTVSWGQPGDVPFPGDFDGDGKTDFGIARSVNGQFQFWRLLSTGTVMSTVILGTTADYVVPGDYDGDHKTDIATVRFTGGQMQWQWVNSSDGALTTTSWGSTGDKPTQGDYDGDGKTDLAIWRPGVNPGDSAFWVHLSSNGSLVVFPWGSPGDFPVAAYNVF